MLRGCTSLSLPVSRAPFLSRSLCLSVLPCTPLTVGRRGRVDSALLRQATYGTARIGLHTAFSEKLKERNGGSNIPFYQKFVSSFLSGAIASSIGNPFDVAVRRRPSPLTAM